MAPIKIKVIRANSEDPKNVAENIGNPTNPKKWLCAPDDVGGKLEVELLLEGCLRIEHVNIGNQGSAFIEIAVGRSSWPEDRKFELLLPSTKLMSPAECKDWMNISKVFMFNPSSFRRHISEQNWDRVRIRCQQPFADKQFGLGFVELRASEKREREAISDAESNALVERGSEKFRNIVNKALNSSGRAALPSKVMSRTEKCLKTALLKKNGSGLKSTDMTLGLKTPKRAGKVSSSSESELEFDMEEEMETLATPRLSAFRSASKLEGRNATGTSSSNRKAWSDSVLKVRKRVCSKKFHTEVELFLKEISVEAMDPETMTVSGLREKMERMRGSLLNKAEKKIFFQVVGQTVDELQQCNDPPLSFQITDRHSTSVITPIRSRRNLIPETETYEGDPLFVGLNEEDKKRMANKRMQRRNGNIIGSTLCYKDDVQGPPRKFAKKQPVEKHNELEKKDEDDKRGPSKQDCPLCGKAMSRQALQIHAAYCGGKSILENDSQDAQEPDIPQSAMWEKCLEPSSHVDSNNEAMQNYQDSCNNIIANAAKINGNLSASITLCNDKSTGAPAGKYAAIRKESTIVQCSSESLDHASISSSQRMTYSNGDDKHSSKVNISSAPSLSTFSLDSVSNTVPIDLTNSSDGHAGTDAIDLTRSTAASNRISNRNDVEIIETRVPNPEPRLDADVQCPICLHFYPSNYIEYHANACADFC